MAHLKYRPEIDGLRTIAVLAVVLFHLGLDWIPGGYLGVDVFFVISGYLIPSILLRDLRAGTFRFRDFWARRVRRILPALLVMVVTVLTCAWRFGFRGELHQVSAQGLSALLSVANFYYLKQAGGYWGADAESSPLLHTWSLAIEEQFYLFLPLTLYLLHRKFPRAILGATLLGAAVSLLGFLALYSSKPSGTFYLLPTRAWELAAGASLACLPDTGRNFLRNKPPLATLGLGLISLSYVWVRDLGPGLLLPVVGSVLIIGAAESGWTHKFLSWSPFVYVGRISYSLYLWHWPVIVMPRTWGHSLHPALAGGLAFALAVASFHGVEQPTRKAPKTVPGALVGLAAAVAFALGLSMSNGLYDVQRYGNIRSEMFYFDLRPDNFDEHTEVAHQMMDLPRREANKDAYKSGGIIIGPHPESPDLVLLGDSHGTMWSGTIRKLSEQLGLTTAYYSMTAVPPFFKDPPGEDPNSGMISSETKLAYDRSRIEHFKKWHPKLTIFVTRWASPFLVEDDARATMKFLSENSGHVLILGQPPELITGRRFAVQHLAYLDVDPNTEKDYAISEANASAFRHGRDLAESIAAQYPNVTFVPIEDLYRRYEDVLVLHDGQVVYYDGDHLTDFGASLARKRLLAELKRYLSPTERN